jgi:hypothetical protein
MNVHTITRFFIDLLNTIVTELNNNKHNTELTHKKIKYYCDFIYLNNSLLLDNHEHLSNYAGMYYVQGHYHDMFGIRTLTDHEKKSGSRNRYKDIPPEYHIHDIVNHIESIDIPLLAEFFNKNIELFEQLKYGIDLIK